MKKKITIKWFLLPSITLLSLAACSEQYLSGDAIPEIPADGVIEVGLFLNAGEFEKPVTRTRTSDENDPMGTMPWVLVFRGDTDNAVFFEASRALISHGKPAVPLTKTTNRSRLLIIANPPDTFFDGVTDGLHFNKTGIENVLSGKTYAQALAVLNTTKLGSPQLLNPYEGSYIPMSASVGLNGIDGQTTIGSPGGKVSLIRVAAKVTVESTTANFNMEGFTVTGAKQYGRFIQPAPSLPPGNTVDYAVPYSTEPLYVYESAAGETSVIVKGRYHSETCYYRLAFQDDNGSAISIARNKWYQFKIKEVTIPGYGTAGEALTAPPSNIVAELTVIDQNAMEITDNGQFYLGLSNSGMIVYSNTAQSNLTAVTIITNAPAGTPALTEILSVSPAHSMSISSGSIAPTGADYNTEVKIAISNVFSAGILKITVGNLIRTIKVERKPVIPWPGSTIAFGPGYVSARIAEQGTGSSGWLTLSVDGSEYVNTEVVRADGPGTVYLKIGRNEPGNLSRGGGVAYVGRKDSEGHLKLHIDQLAGIPR
ncbi:hypothetical protein [Proteiniphilum sp. UBA5384]|uniref:hypothetical protein n=1 Tax=Proteiniphilum sp. UBA5384 TaxID=1947279 RepID=UPI0025E26AF0|nr:hypothetical protein [Proteiniphilum sp. UBA5384]